MRKSSIRKLPIILMVLECGFFSEFSGVRILLLPNCIDVQNNEMLVYRKSLVRIELFPHVKNFFCSNTFA